MPNPCNMYFTSDSTTRRNGENQRTVRSTGCATTSAMRSGALKAAVFGSTSAKMKIRNVMMKVA